MIEIVIGEELKKACPAMTLGCIQAQVTVKNSSSALWEEIQQYCDVLTQEIPIEELAAVPKIKDGREVYKNLGKAPSKYRLSVEALIRRVLQGKGVYKINNVVEINNLISLKSKFAVGSYNIEHLQPPVSLLVGKAGQQYKGIGKELINIENLPILTDAAGSFGSPTSDSERAMITDTVKEIIMCIFSFSGQNDMEEYLQSAKELLARYADGKNIETKIIG